VIPKEVEVARYIFNRLLESIPLLVLISFMVFALTLVIPGDPAVSLAGEDATQERIEEIRRLLGLDRPFLERYFSWLGGVLRGDLGTAFNDGRSVAGGLAQRLPVTLSLAVVTLVYATTVGVTLGSIAGHRANSKVDRFVTLISSMGLAIPHFWLGMLLIMFFSLNLGWLPALGYRSISEGIWPWFRHMLLPSVALGSGIAAEIARQTRASVSNVMDLEYVRTARAKGLTTFRITTFHVLRTACIPVITVIGLQAARLLSASVVIEQLFAVPGLGSFAWAAVSLRDFPVIQGIVLVSAIGVLTINLVVDVIYTIVDPRVRAS
jgi:peptide/nickel transport system permease protein